MGRGCCRHFKADDFKCSYMPTKSNYVHKYLVELPNIHNNIDVAFHDSIHTLLRELSLSWLCDVIEDVSLATFLTYTEEDLECYQLLTVDKKKILSFIKDFHLKPWNIKSSLNLESWKVNMNTQKILLALFRIIQQLYISNASITYFYTQLAILNNSVAKTELQNVVLAEDCERALTSVNKITKNLQLMRKILDIQIKSAEWSFYPCDFISKKPAKSRFNAIFFSVVCSSVIFGFMWKRKL